MAKAKPSDTGVPAAPPQGAASSPRAGTREQKLFDRKTGQTHTFRVRSRRDLVEAARRRGNPTAPSGGAAPSESSAPSTDAAAS